MRSEITNLDMHIHSCYSINLWGNNIFMPPSRSTPEDIIKSAVKKGITCIGIMDHDTVAGSLHAAKLAKKYKVVIMPGAEVSSRDGHILAYGIQENIKSKLSAEETVELIKQQGGFAVAAHPFNIGLALNEEIVMKLRKKLLALEVYNGHSFTNKKVKPFADRHGFAQVAGSDAHSLSEIGNAYFSINHPIHTPEDIIAAIKKKKTVPHLVRNASVMFGIVPNALGSFFYWYGKKIQKVINPKIKLPF